MIEFCPMITQCGWCNPYCSERIKLETLRNLEKDWWGYGKDKCALHGDYPSEEYFCADGERKEWSKNG